MGQRLFEDNFNMKEYVDKRVLQIKDLEQRKLLKDTLSQLFYEYYNYVGEEFEKLGDKVFREIDTDIKKYTIYTSLIPRDQYDETEEAYTPMLGGDRTKREIDANEMAQKVKGGCSYYIYTIFAKCDYMLVKGLGQGQRSFGGIVRTEDRELGACFHLEKNEKYIKRIEGMYGVFQQNALPWMTVCAPYVYKMFDVYVDTIEGLEGSDCVVEVKVDFEEFAGSMEYDCIPVWNITEKREKTSSYPEPCIDHSYFQHTIYSNKLDPGCEYLVWDGGRPIENIRRLDGDILITCKEPDPKVWTLYKFGIQPMDIKGYKVFSNGRASGIEDALKQRVNTKVKTRGEMERFVGTLGYGEVLALEEICLVDTWDGSEQTYNVDQFIGDEFRTGQAIKTMVLKFAAREPEDYLSRDIMGYLVTQIQTLFPEYHCTGILL